MVTEMRQEEVDDMNTEQSSRLAAAVVEFLAREKLNVGICVVVMDRSGYKTVGNVPPEAQAEAWVVLHENTKPGGKGPDAMRVLTMKGNDEPTH